MLIRISLDGNQMHAMPFLRTRLPGEGRDIGSTLYISQEIDFGFQSEGVVCVSSNN